MKGITRDLEAANHEVLKYDDDVQDRYFEMLAAGQLPKFALMCACRKAPMTRHSDRTFNSERRSIMESMNSHTKTAYLAKAKTAGISTQGKYYVGALGKPTDHAAWVSTVDDAKDVCKRKNLSATGLFEHKGQAREYKRTRMAPDIVDSYVASRLQADSRLAESCARDPSALRRVRGEVVDRHSRRYK